MPQLQPMTAGVCLSASRGLSQPVPGEHALCKVGCSPPPLLVGKSQEGQVCVQASLFPILLLSLLISVQHTEGLHSV